MAQLRQRISLVSGLKPLSAGDTRNYIQHRLRVAGYGGGSLFTPQALVDTAEFTEGIPRNINNFCFNAMSLACAMRQPTIDAAIVREVISDLDISQYVTQPRPPERSVARIATGPENGRSEYEWPKARPVETLAPVTGKAADVAPGPLPRRKGKGETLTPTEARAYLEQITRSLKGGQS